MKTSSALEKIPHSLSTTGPLGFYHRDRDHRHTRRDSHGGLSGSSKVILNRFFMCKSALALALGAIMLGAPLDAFAAQVNLAESRNSTAGSEDGTLASGFADDSLVSTVRTFRAQKDAPPGKEAQDSEV